MQLTIIRADSIVYKDGIGYSPLDLSGVPVDVHALQFNTDINSGWIEYSLQPDGTTKPSEDITDLPVWATACEQKWDDADYTVKNPPPPTPEEALFKCKSQAAALLSRTDWTVSGDVGDATKANPYLVNQAEFITYRNSLRSLAINPVVDPIFPDLPVEQWSN